MTFSQLDKVNALGAAITSRLAINLGEGGIGAVRIAARGARTEAKARNFLSNPAVYSDCLATCSSSFQLPPTSPLLFIIHRFLRCVRVQGFKPGRKMYFAAAKFHPPSTDSLRMRKGGFSTSPFMV